MSFITMTPLWSRDMHENGIPISMGSHGNANINMPKMGMEMGRVQNDNGNANGYFFMCAKILGLHRI